MRLATFAIYCRKKGTNDELGYYGDGQKLKNINDLREARIVNAQLDAVEILSRENPHLEFYTQAYWL